MTIICASGRSTARCPCWAGGGRGCPGSRQHRWALLPSSSTVSTGHKDQTHRGSGRARVGREFNTSSNTHLNRKIQHVHEELGNNDVCFKNRRAAPWCSPGWALTWEVLLQPCSPCHLLPSHPCGGMWGGRMGRKAQFVESNPRPHLASRASSLGVNHQSSCGHCQHRDGEARTDPPWAADGREGSSC